MRRAVTTLLAVLLALSVGACKSPPKHSDSTKGNQQERSDTGMHDGPM